LQGCNLEDEDEMIILTEQLGYQSSHRLRNKEKNYGNNIGSM
jgi:hypothetical protein